MRAKAIRNLASAAADCCRTIAFSTKPKSARRRASKLQDSLVLVHGGMAQNVGPILEMVTEKISAALRSRMDGAAGARCAFSTRSSRTCARATCARSAAPRSATSMGPIQTIIPWASNLYTETLIREVRAEFGDDFWGFWMLGGMSGGGMGFIFDPERKAGGAETSWAN